MWVKVWARVRPDPRPHSLTLAHIHGHILTLTLTLHPRRHPHPHPRPRHKAYPISSTMRAQMHTPCIHKAYPISSTMRAQMPVSSTACIFSFGPSDRYLLVWIWVRVRAWVSDGVQPVGEVPGGEGVGGSEGDGGGERWRRRTADHLVVWVWFHAG